MPKSISSMFRGIPSMASTPRCMKKLLAGVALGAFFAASSAHAALVFSNGAGTLVSNRFAGFSPLANLTVTADTLIDQIAVNVDLNTDGNLKFLIFERAPSSAAATLVYSSAPQAFVDDGLTFKASAVFPDFTLQSGYGYFIGAIADVGGLWSIDTTGDTVGGISSQPNNPNVNNFASPTLAAGFAGSDPNIRLFYSGTGVPNSGTVPEPASLALVGLALAGLGLSARRRR